MGHILSWLAQHSPAPYHSLKPELALLETAQKWQSKRWSSPFFSLNSGSIWYVKLYLYKLLFFVKIARCTLSRTETLLGPQARVLCLDKNIPFVSSSCKKGPSFALPLVQSLFPSGYASRYFSSSSTTRIPAWVTRHTSPAGRTVLWLTKPATPQRHLCSMRYTFARINVCCFSPLPFKTATQK